MNRNVWFMFVIMVFVFLGESRADAREINENICKSYVDMYCLRCHPVQRICDQVGVQNESQWQETVKLMAEYGNLDKDVQETVLACMTNTEQGTSAVCGKKSAAAGPTVSHAAYVQTSSQKISSKGQDKIFRSIGPADAMRILQKRDDIIFLDVRTARERSYGAIPGSKLVSIVDLVKGKLDLPKDKPIMLVCAVGGRSYMAGQMLSKQGYAEVYNLSGGVKGWYKAGLPLIQE